MANAGAACLVVRFHAVVDASVGPLAASPRGRWRARFTPFVLLACPMDRWRLMVSGRGNPQRAGSKTTSAVRAALPTEKNNKSGELYAGACQRFHYLWINTSVEQPHLRRPWRGSHPSLSPRQRAEEVLDHGWTATTRNWPRGWTKMSGGEWLEMLKEAADPPPGMVDDMRNLTFSSRFPGRAEDFRRPWTDARAAQGPRRQAAGDDEAFVENFHLGLSLSLAMRRRAPVGLYTAGGTMKYPY